MRFLFDLKFFYGIIKVAVKFSVIIHVNGILIQERETEMRLAEKEYLNNKFIYDQKHSSGKKSTKIMSSFTRGGVRPWWPGH